MNAATLATLVMLAACFWVESLVPLFMERDRPTRLRHAARNVTIGLINGGVVTFGFTGLLSASVDWGALHRLGLLHRLQLPQGWERLVGFVAFDLWMYGWHRANHALPLLWRFHRMHHSDPALDSTSAVRFHVGEMALSALTRLAVVPLLGISLRDLLLYELVLEPVIIFHHSNIALPERWDRRLRLLVVSPNMHRVHHSDLPDETNSNYASVLSLWDRLWRTYRQRETRTNRYGLTEFRDPRWETVPGMLLTPLA